MTDVHVDRTIPRVGFDIHTGRALAHQDTSETDTTDTEQEQS